MQNKTKGCQNINPVMKRYDPLMRKLMIRPDQVSLVLFLVLQNQQDSGWIPRAYLIRVKAINSLAFGKFGWNFRYVIFKRILMIDGWGISCEIALIWMSLDFTDMSTLVKVMAWCRLMKKAEFVPYLTNYNRYDHHLWQTVKYSSRHHLGKTLCNSNC